MLIIAGSLAYISSCWMELRVLLIFFSYEYLDFIDRLFYLLMLVIFVYQRSLDNESRGISGTFR